MDLPSNLIRLFTQLATSGTANTATTGTLLAAPGAGQRYRFWAFAATPNNTAQAAANWRVQWTNGVAGSPMGEVSSANFASPGAQWIPGGTVFGANTPIGYSVMSALASLVLNLETWYTLEAG